MKVYRIHEMAEKLGVSIKTLQRWDNTGKLPARRTPSNQRYYTEDQYLDYIGMPIEKSHRKVVAYARVSSRNQRDDLNTKLTSFEPLQTQEVLFLMNASKISEVD